MLKRPTHYGSVLVIAPSLLLPAYQRSVAPQGAIRYAASIGEALPMLEHEQIAAIVYHEHEAQIEMGRSLAHWFAEARGATPLLAVVASLDDAASLHLSALQPYVSMVFSKYHHRPDEVIAMVVENFVATKKKKQTAK
ncbi:MAG: hypothetical protein WC659_02005 [Patescibacteria group bacterium]